MQSYNESVSEGDAIVPDDDRHGSGYAGFAARYSGLRGLYTTGYPSLPPQLPSFPGTVSVYMVFTNKTN